MAENIVIVLSTDDIENDIRISVIRMDLGITIIYTSCLYKSYPNGYTKYNFLVSLADIAGNAISFCFIQMDLEKKINYIYNMLV